MACRCPTGDHVHVSDLDHATWIAGGSMPELPTPPYPQQLRQESWAIRHCPTCSTWWWMQFSTTIHHTYDRNDEQKILSSLNVTWGNALRCTGQVEAEGMIAWYVEFVRVAARFQKTFPQFDHGDPPEAAKAYAELMPLLRRHAGARYLQRILRSDVQLEHWRQADVRIAPLRRKMIGLMEELKRGRGDAAELARLQQRCFEVRAAEMDPDWHHVHLSELWTPTLAPAHAAAYERGQLIPQQRTLDAAGRTRLIALQRTIEAAWLAFMREVRIPAPLIEFFLLHLQLSDLDPQNLTIDPTVWDQPERIALRLRTLMQQHGLTWSRDQVLHETVERRLGLPPTSERRHQHRR